MTKSQRAQVVEFLKCAADVCPTRDGCNGMFDAEADLDYGSVDTVIRIAWDVRNATPESECLDSNEWYRFRLLEAAARVEEGTWP